MSADWYYSKDQRELGPVPLADLQSLASAGALLPTDLVWTNGMADWQPARQVPELFAPAVHQTAPGYGHAPGYGSSGHPGPHGYASYSDPAYVKTDSTRVSAGICGILLGGLGVHKFILNLSTPGLIMLLVTLLGGAATCGVSALVMHIIGMIEGIKYMLMSDEEFHDRYIIGRREWF